MMQRIIFFQICKHRSKQHTDFFWFKFLCMFCGLWSPKCTYTAARNHLKTHSPEYYVKGLKDDGKTRTNPSCPLCGYVYKQGSRKDPHRDSREHILRHHLPIISCIYDKCDCSYGYMSDMEKHIKRCHPGSEGIYEWDKQNTKNSEWKIEEEAQIVFSTPKKIHSPPQPPKFTPISKRKRQNPSTPSSAMELSKSFEKLQITPSTKSPQMKQQKTKYSNVSRKIFGMQSQVEAFEDEAMSWSTEGNCNFNF